MREEATVILSKIRFIFVKVQKRWLSFQMITEGSNCTFGRGLFVKIYIL